MWLKPRWLTSWPSLCIPTAPAAVARKSRVWTLLVPSANTSGTYGGIDRGTWTFWQSKKYDFSDNSIPGTPTGAQMQTAMNTLWASCTRGNDRPDLIVLDTIYWGIYMASLQAQQRFTSPDTGNLGFPSLKFMDADVVLDGGIGGFCPASTGFFLNTKYMKWRPTHSATWFRCRPTVAMPSIRTLKSRFWRGQAT